MNKDELILEMIKEVRNEQRDIRNDIFDIKKTNMESHLNWMEHTRRTAALERVVDTQGIRIEVLEEPEKVKEAVKNKALKIAGVLTAIISLAAAAAKFL